MSDLINFEILLDKELITILILVVSIALILVIQLISKKQIDRSTDIIRNDLSKLKKYLEIEDSDLVGKILAQEVVDKKTGELIANANDEITMELIETLKEAGVKNINTIYINDVDQGPYISNSLRIDPSFDKESALIEIYRMMRPGEPPTKEAADNLFTNLNCRSFSRKILYNTYRARGEKDRFNYQIN